MEDARPTAVESTSPATTVTDARDFAASTPKAVPKAITEILNQSAPHSGTSTPGFVRTAAEVADSAAILDKEESEPEIPDEEAGRKGVRRMSSTPIAEVAGTAAEVANTAEALDAEKVRSKLAHVGLAYAVPSLTYLGCSWLGTAPSRGRRPGALGARGLNSKLQRNSSVCA